MSSPAIGDIDGDGHLDIVVGGGRFYQGAVGRQVYAWRRDGTPLPGWPVSTTGQVSSSPALADLTGDGIPEVIVSDEPDGSSGPYLYAFRGNGSLLFKVQPKSYFAVTPNIGDPMVESSSPIRALRARTIRGSATTPTAPAPAPS